MPSFRGYGQGNDDARENLHGDLGGALRQIEDVRGPALAEGDGRAAIEHDMAAKANLVHERHTLAPMVGDAQAEAVGANQTVGREMTGRVRLIRVVRRPSLAALSGQGVGELEAEARPLTYNYAKQLTALWFKSLFEAIRQISKTKPYLFV